MAELSERQRGPDAGGDLANPPGATQDYPTWIYKLVDLLIPGAGTLLRLGDKNDVGQKINDFLEKYAVPTTPGYMEPRATDEYVARTYGPETGIIAGIEDRFGDRYGGFPAYQDAQAGTPRGSSNYTSGLSIEILRLPNGMEIPVISGPKWTGSTEWPVADPDTSFFNGITRTSGSPSSPQSSVTYGPGAQPSGPDAAARRESLATRGGNQQSRDPYGYRNTYPTDVPFEGDIFATRYPTYTRYGGTTPSGDPFYGVIPDMGQRTYSPGGGGGGANPADWGNFNGVLPSLGGFYY